MEDNFDDEQINKTNVLDLSGLEPIIQKLYLLKQQEAKVPKITD